MKWRFRIRPKWSRRDDRAVFIQHVQRHHRAITKNESAIPNKTDFCHCDLVLVAPSPHDSLERRRRQKSELDVAILPVALRVPQDGERKRAHMRNRRVRHNAKIAAGRVNTNTQTLFESVPIAINSTLGDHPETKQHGTKPKETLGRNPRWLHNAGVASCKSQMGR